MHKMVPDKSKGKVRYELQIKNIDKTTNLYELKRTPVA